MSAYTQFYLLRAGTVADVLPSATWTEGSWHDSGSRTVMLDGAKYGAVNILTSRSKSSATTPYDLGLVRGISRVLLPQTISGTLDMVLGVREASDAHNFYTRVYAYVWNATDETVLGTLLSYAESAGSDTEWTTTSTGKAFTTPQALSSVVVPDDGKAYHLVIEFGGRAYASGAGTINTQIGAMSSSLAQLSDLTAGSTSTTTLAPFVTFSNAVSVETSIGGTGFVRGRILIPGADDSLDSGVEAATLLDAVTGEKVGFWPELPTAETGDNLPTGEFAITAQASVASSVAAIQIYGPTGSHVASVPTSTLAAGTWGAFSPLRSDQNETFYTLRIAPSTPTTLHAIGADGTVINSWTMPTSAGRGCTIFAPSRDGTKVYFGFRSSDEIATGVGVFDLTGAGTELTPLIPTSAGLSIGRDLVVTAEGDILVGIRLASAGAEIRRYNDAGTLLATYPLEAGARTGDSIELSVDPANNAVFGVRSYPTTTTSTLRTIRISDGVELASLPLTLANGAGNQTLIPLSCPFLMYPGSTTEAISPLLDGSVPCCIDLSTVPSDLDGCARWGVGGAGSSGPIGTPQAGTWSNTLNATDGIGGGGTSAYRAPDVDPDTWGY